MDSKAAAAYLGISIHALHKLTAAREIPFEQDGPGCKCWFRRSQLDRWRRGEGSASKMLPNSPDRASANSLPETKTPPKRGFSESG
jgi:hypothetical protein